MSVSAVQPVSAHTASIGTRSVSEGRPSGLGRREIAVLRAMGRSPDPHDPATIRDAAARMVSELFFVPTLAQMREFPFGNEFGHGGWGEAVFAEHLHQRIADAVATAERGGLVDQLARRLEQIAGGRHGREDAAMPPDGATNVPAGATNAAVSWLTHQQAYQPPEGRSDDS